MSELEALMPRVLALTLEDRRELVQEVLMSLEGPSREALDKEWAAEAMDRLKAYDEGKMGAYTMEELRRGIGL